ncbi:MAG: hypothetical protein ABL885_04075 [Methylophilaceae bacterium]
MLIAGCTTPFSETPIATNFPTSNQLRLQAASHWDTISDDVAKKFSASLSNNKSTPLYVQAVQTTPFNRAVTNQLITSLVQNGYTVVKNPSGTLKVDIDTQVVAFSPNRSQGKYGGEPTPLTVGVWVLGDLTIGASPKTVFKSEWAAGARPKTEIIINTSVSDEQQYIARSTNVYYVADSDSSLYAQLPQVQLNTLNVKGGL